MTDLSDPRPEQSPVDAGESSFDVVLSGIDALGTNSRLIKHWHIAPLPEEDLSEITITFMDVCDGTVDTA